MGGSAKPPRPSERQHVSGWGPQLSLDWRRVSRGVIVAGEREEEREREGEGERVGMEGRGRERAREGEREREKERERERRKERESVCGREGKTERV